MTAYFNKQRGKWVYDFVRGGKRYREYCVTEDGHDVTTQRAADACEARAKKEVEKAFKAGSGGVRVSGAYTVEQMFFDYVSQHAARKRSWRNNIKGHVAELLEIFGRQTVAASIGPNEVERYITYSRAQFRETYKGGPKAGGKSEVTTAPRADSTTNKYLNTLRAAINWAADHGKLATIKIRRLDEPHELPNPVEIDMVNAILAHSPPHLRLAIKIAVHTGMRLDETLSLRWDQISADMGAITLPSRSTKAGVGQIVHINGDLAADLAVAPRLGETVIAYTRASSEEGLKKHPPRPIKSLRRSWHTAQKAAGIANFHRFHDLRATFCTAVLAANNNPITLKDAARHASLTTTMRYAKVADQAVKSAFNATAGLLKSPTETPNTVAGRFLQKKK